MVKKELLIPFGKIPYLDGGIGKTLVFLHGALAMPDAYIDLLNLLEKKYHVIAPTHPGHGEAFSVPSNWELPDMVLMYRDFFRKYNIHPDIFIGHSFGGTIALLLSDLYPDVNTIIMDSPCSPLIVDNLNKYLKAMVDEGVELLKEKPNIDDIKDIAKATVTIFQTIFKHPEDIPYFYKYGPTLDISDKLKNHIGNVTMFWGEEDQIIPLSDGRKMLKLIRNSTLKVFPGKKHNYPVTHPEFTYQELMAVLSDTNKCLV
jgi:pimeloyl-ACP methyl ester carboxylesterase